VAGHSPGQSALIELGGYKMNISGADIWRTAKILIEQHGDDAADHAASRSFNLQYEGDLHAAAAWHRIERAVKWLQDPGPARVGKAH
jgi:hypothetical protein